MLAGGRSSRMGADKALLQVHGQSQLTWTADLLAPFCQEVLASVRIDQLESLAPSNLQLIPDQLEDAGPLAGILAALELRPGNGWLVVACDMPWLDVTTLEQLVANRDCSKPATAFITNKGPEPLCTIWEPGVLETLSNAMHKGRRSPRRILEQLSIQQLIPENPGALLSINTPELLVQARRDFS